MLILFILQELCMYLIVLIATDMYWLYTIYDLSQLHVLFTVAADVETICALQDPASERGHSVWFAEAVQIFESLHTHILHVANERSEL